MIDSYLTKKGIVEGGKYVIIGVSKSGTTSLFKYLDDRHVHVIKSDGWFFGSNSDVIRRDENLKDYRPIIIFRNPIQRAWSHFWWMTRTKKEKDTPKEVLDIRLEKASRYSFYLKNLDKWLDLDPIILSFEIVRSIKNFPIENNNIQNKKILTKNDSILIQKYINQEREEYIQEQKKLVS